MYYVRLGGGTVEVENTDGTKSNVAGYIYDTFTFAVDAGSEEKPQVLIGNVSGDAAGAINSSDATEICKIMANKTGTIKINATDINSINYAAAAYCNGNNQITSSDATEICKYMANKNPEFVGKTVDLGMYGDVPSTVQ